MDPRKRAPLVLAGGVAANLFQGAAYSFSVFKEPLKAHLHCTETQAALAFSLALAFLPVGMLAAGRFADRASPRTVIAFGGLLFACGTFLAGYSNSVAWLYATFGVMMSLGNGVAYGTVVATAVKWYPQRRGMAGGLVVSALGIGTIILAPLAQRLIQVPALGVLGTFRVLGVLFFVVTAGASLLVVSPPKGWGETADCAGEQCSGSDADWCQMLVRSRFWLLYVIYIAGAFPGLMVISQASSIAQELTRLTAAAASLIVGILGFANAIGRLCWGAVSDRIGRFVAMGLMFGITAVMMFGLSNFAESPVGLTFAMLLIGLCYGGYLGIFPSICADTFGSRNLTLNYALLFSAFSLSGILGPRVGAVLKESTGGYATSFMAASSVAVFGLILCLLAGFSDRKRS